MIEVPHFRDRKVAVLGLGRSGLSAAAALKAGGAEIIAWDDGPSGRAAGEAAGLRLVDLSKPGALDGVDALITSPGIPHLYPAPHPAIAAALSAGVPVDNDIGLFFASLGRADWARFDTVPRVVAVTGSNGKSTTAALLHHILNEAGVETQLAGNIGRGVLDLDPPGDGGVIVLELSSYQTELARSLSPDIAVFTNLAPDHLDRHGGLGGYFAAKRRLFIEGGPDRAVIGIDEVEGQYLAGQMAGGAGDERVITVATTPQAGAASWQISVKKGFLSERRKGRQVASVDLRECPSLAGRHNHQNACCAYGAARALGLAPRLIEAALARFEGLPHRSQLVAEAGGVRFINDSKATNVDAALQGLAAFKRIRWIVGGLEKEGGLARLAPAADAVLRAYVIGREAEAFARALAPVETFVAGDMATAVAQAIADSQPGDTVLLAPAAASFDQYDNFERRGEDFEAQVKRVLSRA
ncbi:MAG: UDP-N-acetylmuramoyl-L-alanine--D-glutamate ligase [Pseudomonadota bacterium]